MQPTLVSLHGESHGQRSLEDHSPRGHKRVRCNFVVAQSLSHVQLFVAPWTAALQASLSFTIFQSLLKLMPIESVMPSNHLILYCPLLLLPSVFPSIRDTSQQLKNNNPELYNRSLMLSTLYIVVCVCKPQMYIILLQKKGLHFSYMCTSLPPLNTESFSRMRMYVIDLHWSSTSCNI